jgi:hypothetical protein
VEEEEKRYKQSLSKRTTFLQLAVSKFNFNVIDTNKHNTPTAIVDNVPNSI